MPDKRSVDELSIEELERILAIKKRQARQEQLRRMQASGRVVASAPPSAAPAPVPMPAPSSPRPAVDDSLPRFEDDFSQPYAPTRLRNDGLWRRFLNRSLLLVELSAFAGLIVLGVAMLSGIDQLQRETALAQQEAERQRSALIPTIEPTPTLQLASIVLPGGHTPPSQGGQFNFDEIPSNLREALRDQIFVPPTFQRPQPTDQTPLRLIIPEIDVDHAIVQGVDWEALKLGIGQLPNGATPAQPNQNVVLAAHNDIYGEIFRYLDRLQPGMILQLQTRTQFYSYRVTSTQIVAPDRVDVMEARGYPALTLISCYPYQVNDKRIVVFAERVDT
ncbi:MAG: class D sortase [Anaerolineae bacterium]|nr:class D sortase [Anaerolineae bacterium]MDW8173497.1 class D sortase [Anaerolineae bacterium]